MYPTDNSHVGGFYPPDSVIERETTRNDDAVLYFLEHAACPYSAVASLAVTHCGPLNDDFETARGWTINPDGTDTATSGAFERGIAAEDQNAAGVKQLKLRPTAASTELVTGAAGRQRRPAPTTSTAARHRRSRPRSSSAAPARPAGSSTSSTRSRTTRRPPTADYLRVLVNGTEVFRVAGNEPTRTRPGRMQP